MAFAWLKGLTRVGRLFANFFPKALRIRMRKDDLYKTITEEFGFTYRRDEFENDWRIAREAYNLWDRMKYIRRDRRITERYFKLASFAFEKKYAVTVKIKARNIWTGEEEEKYLTLKHNELLTRGEWENKAIDLYLRYPLRTPEDWEIEDVRVVEAWKNPLW